MTAHDLRISLTMSIVFPECMLCMHTTPRSVSGRLQKTDKVTKLPIFIGAWHEARARTHTPYHITGRLEIPYVCQFLTSGVDVGIYLWRSGGRVVTGDWIGPREGVIVSMTVGMSEGCKEHKRRVVY